MRRVITRKGFYHEGLTCFTFRTTLIANKLIDNETFLQNEFFLHLLSKIEK